jgi:hypothetical protein
MPRNGNEPVVLAILKALTIGGEQRRLKLGSSVQMLYALLADSDARMADPRVPEHTQRTLTALADISGTTVSTADRWRRKLRGAGLLKFDDQDGKREVTDYVFQCDLAMPPVSHKRETESPRPAPALVSQKRETESVTRGEEGCSEPHSTLVSHKRETTEPHSTLVSHFEEPVSHNGKPLKRTRVSPDPTPDPLERDTRASVSEVDGEVQDHLLSEFGIKPNYDHPEFRDAILRAVTAGVTSADVIAACDAEVRNGFKPRSVGGFVQTIKRVAHVAGDSKASVADKFDAAGQAEAMKKLGM